jgi:hypothetical protein
MRKDFYTLFGLISFQIFVIYLIKNVEIISITMFTLFKGKF